MRVRLVVRVRVVVGVVRVRVSTLAAVGSTPSVRGRGGRSSRRWARRRPRPAAPPPTPAGSRPAGRRPPDCRRSRGGSTPLARLLPMATVAGSANAARRGGDYYYVHLLTVA